MVGRIRAHDWAATSLGPIEGWPERLKAVVDLALAAQQPMSVCWGPDNVSIYNDACVRALGARHPAALGRPCRDVWAEIWDEFRPVVAAVMAGEAQSFVDRPVATTGRADQPTSWFTFSWTPLRDEAGAVAGFICVATDTTHDVLARERLLESEKRLQRVLETDAVAVLFFKRDGVLANANDVFLRMTGYSREDVQAGRLTWQQMTPPQWLAVSQEQMDRFLVEGRIGPYEKEYLRKDGSHAWMLFAGRDLGDGTIVELGVEITDRKRAEAALRESETRFRAFVTASSDVVYRMSADWSEMRQLEGRSFLRDTDEPSPGWLDRYIHPEDQPAVHAAIGQAIRTGSTFELEHRVIRADGSLGWTSSRAVPILAAEGTVGEWLGAASDITAKKEAEAARARSEQALRESEARGAFLLRLSDAVRPLQDPVAIQGTATRLLGEHLGAGRVLCAEFRVEDGREYVAVERDYHAPDVPSAAGRYPSELFGPDVPRLREGRPVAVSDVEADLAAEGERAAWRALGVRAHLGVPLMKDGRLAAGFGVRHASPRAWTAGDVALVAEAADRTWAAVERARAEARLRESEERYLGLYNAFNQGFCTVEVAFGPTGRPTDYRFLEVSPSFEAQTGIKDAAGKWMRDIAPDQDQFWFEAYGRVALTGEPARFEAGSGPLGRWWSVYAYRIGDPARRTVAVLFSDTTGRKRAEDALRESEERLRQFGEASQDVLWIRDAETFQWTYLTPAFEAIYGLDRASALRGDNMAGWAELILPEDRERAVGSLRRVRDGEWVTFEYRVRRPADGQVRWLRNTDFPIRDETGRVARIGGVGHDVTAMKETEEALAAAEQRQRLILEGIPQLVWRAVNGGHWTWASPQWTKYTGQAEADSHGWGWLAPLHPDDREAARGAWEQAVEAGGFEAEYRIRRASQGDYRWFQTRATPVRDAGGGIVEWLGTSNDIHDLRELQERQKVLVAELQHRTRNLIAVIRSTADKTARASAGLADFRAAFRDRLDALARVQGLLSRLEEHDRVTFDELMEAEMSALDGAADRVRLDGPSGVRLRSSMVQTLAMALHELATNAVKYGALGQPQGRLAVSWALERGGPDGQPSLHIDWRESGVAMPPAGARPGGGGQGRALIERALPYQLSAKTTYVLGPDGVHCTIMVPISTGRTAGDAKHG